MIPAFNLNPRLATAHETRLAAMMIERLRDEGHEPKLPKNDPKPVMPKGGRAPWPEVMAHVEANPWHSIEELMAAFHCSRSMICDRLQVIRKERGLLVKRNDILVNGRRQQVTRYALAASAD